MAQIAVEIIFAMMALVRGKSPHAPPAGQGVRAYRAEHRLAPRLPVHHGRNAGHPVRVCQTLHHSGPMPSAAMPMRSAPRSLTWQWRRTHSWSAKAPFKPMDVVSKSISQLRSDAASGHFKAPLQVAGVIKGETRGW